MTFTVISRYCILRCLLTLYVSLNILINQPLKIQLVDVYSWHKFNLILSEYAFRFSNRNVVFVVGIIMLIVYYGLLAHILTD